MSEAKLKTKDRLAILFLLAQHRLFSTKKRRERLSPKMQDQKRKKSLKNL
ncbi:hypothetical protein MGA3_01250 [Bacillus methanolicus MGA3]|nr:hypothetical protein MGA3_01250 [Bacillus methanolicus MGA3]